MPLWKCRNCQHEWESLKQKNCDWCAGNSRMLQKETPFESYVKEMMKNPEEFHKKLMK